MHEQTARTAKPDVVGRRAVHRSDRSQWLHDLDVRWPSAANPAGKRRNPGRVALVCVAVSDGLDSEFRDTPATFGRCALAEEEARARRAGGGQRSPARVDLTGVGDAGVPRTGSDRWWRVEEAGVRVRLGVKPQCPRFHVDRVAVRAVWVASGAGTEWLDDRAADRTRLGDNSGGKPDAESGLILNPDGIHEIGPNRLANFKGENWTGNEGKGIIHRSPPPTEEPRLVVTLDWLDP